jgi:multimeric flavodoxin WrbA
VEDILADVLGLAASPRKGGNSEILLDSCLEGALQAGLSTEKIRVCDLKLSPCLNCGGCAATGSCVVQDEMQMLHKKFHDTKLLVVSSPVFFMGLPAQLKVVVDRCQAIWARKYLLHIRMPEPQARRAVFIQVGGMKKERIFEGGLITIGVFFATLDYAFHGKLLLNNIDAKGAVQSHPDALRRARELGKALALGTIPEAMPGTAAPVRD